MTTNNSSRGGSRRRSNRNRGASRNGNGAYRSEKPAYQKHAAPKTLLGKLQAFFKKLFGGKNKPSTTRNRDRDEKRGSDQVTTSSARHARSKGITVERGDRQPPLTHAPEPKTELEAPNLDLVTSTRLYVGNLSYDTTESDLFDLFSQAGSVRNVELVMDRRSNRSKGFGFVEMNDLEVAKQAVLKFHRFDFMGRNLIVSGAKGERREAGTVAESRDNESSDEIQRPVTTVD